MSNGFFSIFGDEAAKSLREQALKGFEGATLDKDKIFAMFGEQLRTSVSKLRGQLFARGTFEDVGGGDPRFFRQTNIILRRERATQRGKNISFVKGVLGDVEGVQSLKRTLSGVDDSDLDKFERRGRRADLRFMISETRFNLGQRFRERRDRRFGGAIAAKGLLSRLRSLFAN